MSQLIQKSGPKFEITTSSRDLPSTATSQKRKREDEPFKKMVMPKLTPTYDLQNKKFTAIKVPSSVTALLPKSQKEQGGLSKSVIPSKSHNDIADQIKKSLQNFTQNYKKNTTNPNFLTKEPVLNTSKPTQNSSYNKTAKPVLNIKKMAGASLKQEYEAGIKEIVNFDKRKEPLLAQFAKIIKELDETILPELSRVDGQIRDIENKQAESTNTHQIKANILRTKLQQSEQMKQERIKALQEREKLNLDMTNMLKRIDIEINFNVRSNEECKRQLENDIKRLRDLNREIESFKEKIEIAKNSVKMRFLDFKMEEKRIAAIEELTHMKKRNIRTIALIESQDIQEKESQIYKIHPTESKRRLKLDLNGDKNSYFEFEGVYKLNDYRLRDKEVFETQENIALNNIFSSIIETEQSKSNYTFTIFSWPHESLEIVQKLRKELHTFSEIECLENDVEYATMEINGKLDNCKRTSLSELNEELQDENLKSKDIIISFIIKLKSLPAIKRLSFIIFTYPSTELVENIGKTIEKSKNSEANVSFNQLELTTYENITTYLKSTASISSHFAIFWITESGEYMKNLSDQKNITCVELLDAFTRFAH